MSKVEDENARVYTQQAWYSSGRGSCSLTATEVSLGGTDTALGYFVLGRGTHLLSFSWNFSQELTVVEVESPYIQHKALVKVRLEGRGQLMETNEK